MPNTTASVVPLLRPPPMGPPATSARSATTARSVPPCQFSASQDRTPLQRLMPLVCHALLGTSVSPDPIRKCVQSAITVLRVLVFYGNDVHRARLAAALDCPTSLSALNAPAASIAEISTHQLFPVDALLDITVDLVPIPCIRLCSLLEMLTFVPLVTSAQQKLKTLQRALPEHLTTLQAWSRLATVSHVFRGIPVILLAWLIRQDCVKQDITALVDQTRLNPRLLLPLVDPVRPGHIASRARASPRHVQLECLPSLTSKLSVTTVLLDITAKLEVPTK